MNIIKIGMRYLYFGKGKGMNIKECYALMEADYEGAIECLLTEERLLKFYKMFNQATYLSDLEKSMNDKDYENAFLTVHGLKGICSSLGFAELKQSSSELCEALRGGNITVDVCPLFEQVKKDYQRVLEIYKLLEV